MGILDDQTTVSHHHKCTLPHCVLDAMSEDALSTMPSCQVTRSEKLRNQSRAGLGLQTQRISTAAHFGQGQLHKEKIKSSVKRDGNTAKRL